MQANEQQTPAACVSCGHPLHGRFCSQCGEKVLNANDRKVTHFFEEVFHILTHADSKFLRSLKYLFTKPGFLTREYLDGRRKLYTGILSLFFIGNVIYLLALPVDALNSKYVSQLYGQPYSEGITKMAETKRAARHWTVKEMEENYDHRSATVSKFMMLVFVLLVSVPAFILFYSNKNYYFDYIVFATEFVNFLMYVVFLALPYLLWGAVIVVQKVFHVKTYPNLNSDFGILILLLILWGYLNTAAKRVFRQNWTAARTLLLTLSLSVITILYRYLLFHITLASL
jgi:hypothetical protein